MKRIKEIFLLFLIPLLFNTLLFGKGEETEKYIGETFVVSAPVLIAGDLFLNFPMLDTFKASLTSLFVEGSEIYGNLPITYVKPDIKDIKLSKFYLSSNNFFTLVHTLYYKKINMLFAKRTEFYLTSNFKLIFNTEHLVNLIMNTEKSSRNYTYAINCFTQDYPTAFTSIDTKKPKKIKKKLIEYLEEKEKPRKKNPPSSHQKKEEKTSKKYTLIVAVTTPISQVFNIIPKDTYLILSGMGIEKKVYLGKLSGTESTEVVFENLTEGSYTLRLIWSNKSYTKLIKVPEDLHVDFMIVF
ncbi:hypothetical protein JYK00_00635 [Thermosipho ferrireducens]|uniref:Uncharacterized protein n=1 Tax=Thermosipho ferrireducens TaxID=2571116 RepID=A0ABX7S9N0_9BACT|nr:hypothetical protein [Thermosipho ferrireducens]QTA38088.1 hypothetical protein JYK00_00635 [Thermosipho ferrireducens]